MDLATWAIGGLLGALVARLLRVGFLDAGFQRRGPSTARTTVRAPRTVATSPQGRTADVVSRDDPLWLYLGAFGRDVRGVPPTLLPCPGPSMVYERDPDAPCRLCGTRVTRPSDAGTGRPAYEHAQHPPVCRCGSTDRPWLVQNCIGGGDDRAIYCDEHLRAWFGPLGEIPEKVYCQPLWTAESAS